MVERYSAEDSLDRIHCGNYVCVRVDTFCESMGTNLFITS